MTQHNYSDIVFGGASELVGAISGAIEGVRAAVDEFNEETPGGPRFKPSDDAVLAAAVALVVAMTQHPDAPITIVEKEQN